MAESGDFFPPVGVCKGSHDMILPASVQKEVIPRVSFDLETQPPQNFGAAIVVRDIIRHYSVQVHFGKHEFDAFADCFGHVAVTLKQVVYAVSEIAKLRRTTQNRSEIYRADYLFAVPFSFIAQENKKIASLVVLKSFSIDG